jgi:hypothetical protein
VDKKLLLQRKASLDTDTVDLGPGLELTVRGLTNGEVHKCRDKAKDNRTLYEHLLISTGLVDPVMTVAEVALWLEGDPDDPEDVGAPAGDHVQVLAAIQRLSGLAKEDATKSVRPVRRGQRR